MRKLLKEERGFTLVEMLLVMLVITVLLLIMIPNVFDKNSYTTVNKVVQRKIKK